MMKSQSSDNSLFGQSVGTDPPAWDIVDDIAVEELLKIDDSDVSFDDDEGSGGESEGMSKSGLAVENIPVIGVTRARFPA